jgi:ankyrin repeat protein
VAADAGQLELVRFLLAEGAACDPQNEEGHTPLHLASVSH